MRVVQAINDVREEINIYKTSGLTVGFVPTMGYLHEGHLSLMRAAKQDCDKVVVSIFVNPTQFAAGEDFEKYPRDIERDSELAQGEGTDILFVPEAGEMYPEKETTFVDSGDLGQILCGKYRPTHFRGVATVVAKLFNILQSDVAYFGQKDYQQAVIIKKVTKDLNFPIKIKVMPIIRESDGLAMSSRNSYLNPEQRKAAPVIYKSLQAAEQAVKNGEKDVQKIIQTSKQVLETELLCNLQYFEIADPETLQPLKQISDQAAILIAAYIGEVRLIDNMIVSLSEGQDAKD